MNSVEKVKAICKERKIPISKLEKELEFSNGYINQLKKGVFPDDRLRAVAEYLEVSTDSLTSGIEGDITKTCFDCGLTYNPSYPEDIETHEKQHTAWKKAVQKFGELYCYSPECERIKAEGRNISHDTSLPLSERCDAQLRVLRCLFSRSVEANQFNLKHIPFETYISMMLGNKSYRKNLENDLFDALSDKYGVASGISYGSIYKIPSAQPTLTEKDNRDIKKDLNNLMAKLSNQEYGPAAYDGEEIPEADLELFEGQLELMLRRLKAINKEKYNPHKNKK